MRSRPEPRSEATWPVRAAIETRSPARSEARKQRAGDPSLQAVAFCALIPSAIVQEICPNHSGGTRRFLSLESLVSSTRRESCQMFARPSRKELLTRAKFTKRGLTRQVQEFCPSRPFSSVVGYAHESDGNERAVHRGARRHRFSRCRSRPRGWRCRGAHR